MSGERVQMPNGVGEMETGGRTPPVLVDKIPKGITVTRPSTG